MRANGNAAWKCLAILVVTMMAGCAEQAPRSDQGAMNAAKTADARTQSEQAGNVAAGSVEKAAPGSAAPGKIDSEEGTLTLASFTDTQPDRYLIKNATISLESADGRKALEQIVAFARNAHGYVSDSHETVDGLGARSLTIQVRVPASQFDASMQQLENWGKILDKQVNAQDVTEEFVDSQARLHNLQSTERRLLDHLSKTGKLSDTLLLEKELTRVRQEIEQITGRLKFLAHRIAYSTLNITVHETPKAQAITPPETFSSGKVASDAARSLVGFGQGLWSIAIWLGIWGVIWLPIALLVRALLRRKSASKYTPSL